MSIYIPSSNTGGITVSQLLSYGYVNQNTLNNSIATKANLSGNISFSAGTGTFTNLTVSNTLTTNKSYANILMLADQNISTSTVCKFGSGDVTIVGSGISYDQ